MTIDQLISRLSEYPPDTRVIIWDPESGQPEDITGFLYSERERTLELQSDEID